jgi:two-component system response regulator MtrA
VNPNRNAPAPPPAAPSPSPAKILLAEDDRFLCKAASAALRRKGWEVVVAGDGEAALEAVRAGGVDLVLLDLILPRLDGFEVLARLRQNPATARTRVIVLTNLGQVSDIRRARECGAEGYMVKGELDLADLTARVEGVLAARPAP